MVTFVLVLYFEVDEVEADRKLGLLSLDEAETIADNQIRKIVEMPVIPRVGETIVLGSLIEVEKVWHFVEERTVEVQCDVGLNDALEAYHTDKEGWEFRFRTLAGNELFLRKLKEREGASPK